MRRGVVLALTLGVGAFQPTAASAADGEQLYAASCAACHQADGSGVPGLAPPLRGDVWRRLGGNAREYLASVMVSGLVGVPLDGQRYVAAMPSWSYLSDEELAAIGSFVLKKLNGDKKGLATAAIREARRANLDNEALKRLRREDR